MITKIPIRTIWVPIARANTIFRGTELALISEVVFLIMRNRTSERRISIEKIPTNKEIPEKDIACPIRKSATWLIDASIASRTTAITIVIGNIELIFRWLIFATPARAPVFIFYCRMIETTFPVFQIFGLIDYQIPSYPNQLQSDCRSRSNLLACSGCLRFHSGQKLTPLWWRSRHWKLLDLVVLHNYSCFSILHRNKKRFGPKTSLSTANR